MATLVRALAIAAAASVLAGCSGKSGYNVDMRNITSETVRVELKAREGDQPPTLAASTSLIPGGYTTLFTNASSKAKVTLEAGIQGDTQHPPAAMPITLGTTNVDIIPVSDKQAADPKAPRVRIRTRD